MSVPVEGTVLYQSGAPVKDAVVKVSSLDNHIVVPPAVTDTGGKYAFQLEPGEWEIIALHVNGLTDPQRRTVTNQPISQLDFQLRAFFEHAQKAGERFLIATIIALILLVVVYIALHVAIPPSQEPLDATLTGLVSGLRSQKDSESTEAAAATGAVLVSRLNSLAENEQLSRMDRSDIANRSRRLAALLESGELSALDTQLDELDSLLANIASPPSFFWHDEQKRYLEIAFAALAGVLVSKILSSAYFLFRKRFYAAGIYMHVGHFVVVPVLAFVTTMLLAQATLQLTLSESNVVTLDFSRPEVALLVSFLISLHPWQLWDFVRGAAYRVLNRQNPT